MKRLFVSLTLVLSIGLLTSALTPTEIRNLVVNNVMLQNRMERIKVEQAQSEAENSLAGPELEFEHLWGHSGDKKWSLGLTQQFEWPGLYSARKNLIQQNIEAANYELEAERLNVTIEVTKLLAQLSYTQQRIDFITRFIGILKNLDAQLSNALNGGAVTILDKKKTDIELVKLNIELEKFVSAQNIFISDLIQIGDRMFRTDGVNWLEMPLVPALKDYDYYIGQIASDPAVLSENAKQRSARLNMDVAKKSSFPGFGIGYRHEYEEGTHFDGFALSLSFPTWGIGKKRLAAKMEYDYAVAMKDTQEKLCRVRIESEYSTAKQLCERINLLQPKVDDLSYLNLLNEALSGGELTILDYLREQAYFLDLNLGLLDLKENYTLLLISLNRYDL